MSSFTPGPWHVGVRPGPIVYGRLGEQVADLRSDTMMPDETRSNARLIAESPAMLEALGWALGQIGDGLDLEAQDALESARATVKRAKGE